MLAEHFFMILYFRQKYQTIIEMLFSVPHRIKLNQTRYDMVRISDCSPPISIDQALRVSKALH